MTGHGRIVLIEERCTACVICARECPTWCISLSSHTEPLPDSPPGPRQRTRAVLDSFELDWARCMYCGICVEACPFDALAWAPGHVRSASAPAELTHDRHQLSSVREVDSSG